MTNLWSKSTLSEPSNSIPVILVSQNTLGQALAHTGEDGDLEKHFDKAAELNPLDPNAILYKDGLFSAQMGLDNYEAAFDLIEEIISQFPKTGNRRGFKAPVMGYLNKGDEVKRALDEYLGNSNHAKVDNEWVVKKLKKEKAGAPA